MEATAALYLLGVRPLWDGARGSSGNAPALCSRGWRLASCGDVLRQAGLIHHLGCGPFCSPQIRGPQPTGSEWERRVGTTVWECIVLAPVSFLPLTGSCLSDHSRRASLSLTRLRSCCCWRSIEIHGIRGSKKGSWKRKGFLSFQDHCGKYVGQTCLGKHVIIVWVLKEWFSQRVS